MFKEYSLHENGHLYNHIELTMEMDEPTLQGSHVVVFYAAASYNIFEIFFYFIEAFFIFFKRFLRE